MSDEQTLPTKLLYWLNRQYYRGKKRVLLVEGEKVTPIAFEVTNITEAAIGVLDPDIPTNPKPESEPFSWERLIHRQCHSNETIRESLQRWGTIIEDDWYRHVDAALGRNRFEGGVTVGNLQIEHWTAYQFTVGTIGYIRVVVK